MKVKFKQTINKYNENVLQVNVKFNVNLLREHMSLAEQDMIMRMLAALLEPAIFNIINTAQRVMHLYSLVDTELTKRIKGKKKNGKRVPTDVRKRR